MLVCSNDGDHHGLVQFWRVEMAYGEKLPPVLRDLSFRAEGGWMTGIVGRTGAGKSSIAAALFRLCELRRGAIRIDGVDVGSVALHTLRRRLAVVSQDPVLFSGPLLACESERAREGERKRRIQRQGWR